jgi:hypothetical protein
MKKLIIVCITLIAFTTACRTLSTLSSVTTIKGNDSFILGNNEHRAYAVDLKNISSKDVTVYMAPIKGGTHTYQVVKPNQKVNVNVEKNTALVVENMSKEEVSVALKIVGNIYLSMGYKN